MFTTRFMPGIADVSLEVTRFIALEMVEGLCSVVWKGSVIAVPRIVAIIDMAVKATRSVEPGTSSNEDAAVEPVRAVVAVGGTFIRSVVEVAVRTARGRATNTHSHRDLGRS